MRLRLAIAPSCVVLLCVALVSPSRADWLHAEESDRVSLDPPRDALIVTVGLLGAAAPLAFTSQFEPASCRWCDGSVRSAVNPVDDWFHARLTASVFSRSTSDSLSTALAFGVTPVVALGSALFATGPDASAGAGLRNTVIVVESVAIAGAFTNALKYSAGRQRPYAHYGNVAAVTGSGRVTGAGSTLSFPSGHTSTVAAATTSAAMLATLEDSPAAPWMWAAAGLLTAATGTLRMASESHYFTDVVGGAAVGAGAGVLFPLLHRRGSLLGGRVVPQMAADGQGAMLGMAGIF